MLLFVFFKIPKLYTFFFLKVSFGNRNKNAAFAHSG